MNSMVARGASVYLEKRVILPIPLHVEILAIPEANLARMPVSLWMFVTPAARTP